MWCHHHHYLQSPPLPALSILFISILAWPEGKTVIKQKMVQTRHQEITKHHNQAAGLDCDEECGREDDNSLAEGKYSNKQLGLIDRPDHRPRLDTSSD